MECGHKMFAIKFWDTERNTTISTMLGHEGHVFEMVFSPNGNLIASCSGDGTVRIWHLNQQRQILELHGHSLGVRRVAFSPDQRTVVSGGSDGRVVFWDLETGREMQELNLNADFIQGLTVSADGQTLATSSHVGGGCRTGASIFGWHLAPRSNDASPCGKGRKHRTGRLGGFGYWTAIVLMVE